MSTLAEPILFHRVDDITEADPAVISVLEAFASRNLACIAAVIPEYLTPEMARFLRDLRNCVVYQHGAAHNNMLSAGYPDEFPPNRPLNEIKIALLRGRDRIEDLIGRPVYGYVPPWNTTSQSAISILEMVGFTVYSGHQRFLSETSMHCIPINIDTVSSYEPITLKPLSNIVSEINIISRNLQSIGVMYHVNGINNFELSSVSDLIYELSPRSATLEEIRCIFPQF